MQGRTNRLARWIPPWLVLACLVLVLGSAAAQALHFHLDGLATDAKHCPVCPLLHSTARVAVPCHNSVTLQATGFLYLPLDSDSRTDFESPAHFSRPPPLA
jgi:hypothetical protein